MTDEMFIQTEGYAIVHVNRDEKGAPIGCMLETCLGFVATPEAFIPVTLRGKYPGTAVLCPDEGVTFDDKYFEDVNTFLSHVKEILQ